ncbi:helix-turn-helix transcriptional regulator, partial [Leptolyngbya sp. AN03gr2]
SKIRCKVFARFIVLYLAFYQQFIPLKFSPRKLLRLPQQALVKQSTGLTPHQYVIQRRIERAKQLLRAGNLTIAQIALQVGFAHQSHLNRHFKKWVGVTPKVFVNNL